jgi:hypothetical protein
MAGKKSPVKGQGISGGVNPQMEKGSSPAGGTTLERHVKTANRWRENYNPLRGLVISTVVSMLEAGERGEYANLQWLYRSVEKRFPTLRALIKRWRGAMGKLDWQVKVIAELPPGASEAMAQKQQETLRTAYERIDNLREAINFLMHKEFRGYAHLNKHRATGGEHDGAVVHLEPIDQWNWVKDPQTCEWFYNREANPVSHTYFRSRGDTAIKAGHPDFIIGLEDMPVSEIAVILFLRANLCEKDWDGFIELFGIERPNVIGPPNVPKDKEDEYLEAAERIANGEGGYLPNGSEVVYPGQRSQGGAPFKERLDYIQEQLVLAGTSGQLTMLSKPTGIGQGASGEHADVFEELAANAASEISEIFQKQFDREVLAAEHPNEPVCVYFELGDSDAIDEEDRKFLREVWRGFQSDGTTNDIMANVTNIRDLTEVVGLPVNPEYEEPYLPVRDEKGGMVTGEVLKDAEGDVVGGKAEEAAEPAAPGEPGEGRSAKPTKESQPPDGQPDQGQSALKNRSGDVPRAQTEALRAALMADLQVFLDRINAVVGIEDDSLRRAKAQGLLADFESMKRSALADPEAARVLRSLMSEQMLRAMAGRNS